jgi:hypothetical protein
MSTPGERDLRRKSRAWSRPIARRIGLWFLSAGLRLAGGRGDRVIVEFAGGGTNGRRTITRDGHRAFRRLRD